MNSRRRRPDPVRGSRAGADEALDMLVAQFADPLAFLRELVQNSLDASSTRIDIAFARSDRGVMTVSVTDNGEGMNERIIDDYLLTLFSSSRENDLTKIGKFGVGFVSIFAIEPDLVVVETGQAGEAWRVLFHRDRTYEKLRLDRAVDGTTVSLHKSGDAAAFAELRERGTAAVRYWCKYVEADLRVDGEPIVEPFGVDAGLAVLHEVPGTEIAVGFAGLLPPLVGFYNRGLTLVEGAALPHRGADDLAGLSLRVKSRYLEHTLTRDNILQDENYDRVIELVREAVRTRLRPRLAARLEELAAALSGPDAVSGEAGAEFARALEWAKLPSMQLAREGGLRMLPSLESGPISLDQVRAQPKRYEGLVAPESTALTRLLAERGCPVIKETGAVRDFLRSCGIVASAVDAAYYTAAQAPANTTDGALLGAVRSLLDEIGARAEHVHIGDLDYRGSAVAGRLHVRQRDAFGLSEVEESSERPGLLGGPRQVVLAVRHPLVIACRELAASEPQLAATLLAYAVAAAEEVEPDRRQQIVARALAWRRAGAEAGA